MKTVFNNASDVIHVFAQQSQERGRSSNVFFEKNKLYSYGYHYLLAEVFEHKGEQCIMINDKGYSNTTSNHISITRGATRQYRQFFTTQTEPKYVLDQLEQLLEKFSRARKPAMYVEQAQLLFVKYQEYKLFKGCQDVYFNNLIESIIKSFDSDFDYFAEKIKLIKKAEAKEASENVKRIKKELVDFMSYEKNSIYNTTEDFIRISKDGQSVETSQRITIPVKEAKILYLMIKNKKDIHGYRICGYTVIGLNGVLKIGCHKINKKNMIEIGEQLLKLS